MKKTRNYLKKCENLTDVIEKWENFVTQEKKNDAIVFGRIDRDTALMMKKDKGNML